MRFPELIIYRRSIRRFQERPVPEKMIRDVINDSLLAPSAGNEQPWKFAVVTNTAMINQISDECKKSLLKRIASNPGDYAGKYGKMLQNEDFQIFYHAPAVIFILGESGLKNLYADCALAASYLMLSATSRGLGTCWVNFGTEINSRDLRNHLGLSENDQIVAPIALGYPDKIPDIPHRKKAQIITLI